MRDVFLLRAVNVGGFSVPMADLRALAGDLGATMISTHIASGNLLCVAPGPAETFARELELGIHERWGAFREVIVRTADELDAALAAHPFETSNPAHNHVHALVSTPAPEAVARLAELDVPEELAVIGADLHIRYPSGAGSSKLTAAKLARVLGVQGTSRNVRTIAQLAHLARTETS